MNKKIFKIGDAEYEFSAFALGTHIFGLERIRNHLNEEESKKIFYQYLQGGGNVIDTARCYGQSEAFIGRFFAAEPALRKQIFLSTKGGTGDYYKDGKLCAYPRLSKEELRQDLYQSLDALQTDAIDLYFLHKDDPAIPPEELIETLEEFRKNGLIRAYGASNMRAERLDQANRYAKSKGYAGFAASQLAFSPYRDPDCQWRNRELCIEMNDADYQRYLESQLPVFAYNSQAGGFFYKNINTPDDAINASAENLEKLRYLRALCREKGITPHQAIFGFFAGLPIPALPIATSTSPEHLALMLENCDIILENSEILPLL